MDIRKAVCEMARCLFYCLLFWCSAHEKMHVEPATAAKDERKNTPLHGEGQRRDIFCPVCSPGSLTAHSHPCAPSVALPPDDSQLPAVWQHPLDTARTGHQRGLQTTEGLGGGPCPALTSNPNSGMTPSLNHLWDNATCPHSPGTVQRLLLWSSATRSLCTTPHPATRRTRARAGPRERAADCVRWRMRVAPSPPYPPAPHSGARTGWGRGSRRGRVPKGRVPSRRALSMVRAAAAAAAVAAAAVGVSPRREIGGAGPHGRDVPATGAPRARPLILGERREQSVRRRRQQEGKAAPREIVCTKVSSPAAVLVSGHCPGPRRRGGSRRGSCGRERPREGSVQTCPGGRGLR